jgi:hypothetical protein
VTIGNLKSDCNIFNGFVDSKSFLLSFPEVERFLDYYRLKSFGNFNISKKSKLF